MKYWYVHVHICVSTVDWEVMCIYRALQNEIPSTDGPTTNPSLTTPLTLNQFYSLYSVIDISWRQVNCFFTEYSERELPIQWGLIIGYLCSPSAEIRVIVFSWPSIS